MKSKKSDGCQRKYWIIFAVLVGMIAGSYFFKNELLPLPAKFLVRDDHPHAGADALVLLMGNSLVRAPKAAELYQQGMASLILMAKPEKSDVEREGWKLDQASLAMKLLTELGVPGDGVEIVSLEDAHSTYDEALASLGAIKKNHADFDRIVVVTSWFHTARAGWIFEKVFEDSGIKIAVIPVYKEKNAELSWWQNEQPFLEVFTEYLKWFYYLTHY